jgi:glucose-6-phosphate isomerase
MNDMRQHTPPPNDLSTRAGLDVSLLRAPGGGPHAAPPALAWGANVAAPAPETRFVRDLAPVLRDAARSGDPDSPVYDLHRDAATPETRPEIERRGLLFVAVAVRAANLGDEKARTRGHVNSHAARTATVFPEVVEVWHGRALVYLQAKADAEAGGDVATLELAPGDKAVVPPGWASLVVNVGGGEALVYGSWRARECEPQHAALEALGGMAHFILEGSTNYALEPNERYRSAPIPRSLFARDFPTLGLLRTEPMFTTFRRNPDVLRFMTRPQDYANVWTTLLNDAAS